jgi:hypothetical protein
LSPLSQHNIAQSCTPFKNRGFNTRAHEGISMQHPQQLLASSRRTVFTLALPHVHATRVSPADEETTLPNTSFAGAHLKTAPQP